jgi:hypothetical protein
MIQHLISVNLFEAYMNHIYSVLSDSEVESLYQTLFETMQTFSFPQPLVSSVAIAELPKKPSRFDAKYQEIPDLDTRKAAYKADILHYLQIKQQIQDEMERQRHEYADIMKKQKLQKSQSFHYLKVLIRYRPDLILKAEACFCSPRVLHVQQEISSGESSIRSTREVSAWHEHQDFFDVLFCSKILYLCLDTNKRSVPLIHDLLDAFLSSNKQHKRALKKRYWLAVDRILKLTRFNNVANISSDLWHYRRHLLTYLVNEGSALLGFDGRGVFAKCLLYELFSLFESLCLFDIFGSIPTEVHIHRMRSMLWTKEEHNGRWCHHLFPILYLTYYPLPNRVIKKMLADICRKDPMAVSNNRWVVFSEIFAMIRSVKLLPIFKRKVVYDAMDNKENAVFDWHRPGAVSHHERYPCGVIAARVLLARQCGISFDSSNLTVHFQESWNWSDYVDLVNLVIEHEVYSRLGQASTFIERGVFDHQVYRVIDSQREHDRNMPLPRDEPTHPIHIAIAMAFSVMSKEDVAKIRSNIDHMALFERIQSRMNESDIAGLLNLSPEECLLLMRRL